ncbi:MAG: hypothetical protein SFH39_18265, partial [Candidatus Magnetobacterium sp. LHC-1]
MGNNNTSITIAISGKVESGQRAVYIDGELSHHIYETEVVRLLGEAHNSLWRTTPTAGADLGMRLYNLFNRGNATLTGIVDGGREVDKNVHIYLRVPVELTQLPFELLHNGEFVLLRHNIHVIRLVEDRGKLSPVELKKEPLKMLFMACSPTDVH